MRDQNSTGGEDGHDYTGDHEEQQEGFLRRIAGVGSDDVEPDHPDPSGPDRGGISAQRAGEVRSHPEEGGGPNDAQARIARDEAQFLSASWTGLLPHPSDFGAYERILPGAADRLLRVLESETVDRSKRADKLANAEIASSKTDRRTVVAFLLLFTTLAVVFFALGNPVAGGFFLTPPILGLVKVMWPGSGPVPGPSAESLPEQNGDEE